jgi:multicomponent Na+:H+ antiporter subunit G
MASFLYAAAGLVLAMTVLGLVRILCGPGNADRMAAAQFNGTCRVAILVLVATASKFQAIVDVALLLALLAAFASVAFVRDVGAQGNRLEAEERMTFGLDLFTVLAVSAGCLFFVAGTVGLLRFPDTLTRLHALTQADNLGLGLIVLGVLPQSAGMLGALKLLCVWPIAQVSSAVVSPQITAASARRARCALACGCCRCRRAALGDHPAVANMPLQAALAPAALWEALWPALAGALLAVVLQHRLPSCRACRQVTC